jgi:hypothetical protein
MLILINNIKLFINDKFQRNNTNGGLPRGRGQRGTVGTPNLGLNLSK